MVRLNANEEHKSTAVAGVTIVLRRITEALRGDFKVRYAEIHERIREISEEMGKLEQAPQTEEDKTRYDRLGSEMDAIIRTQMNPAYLREIFVSADLEIGDTAVTADNMRSLAPSAFYEEVIELIRLRAALGGAEAKNLESPSTSSEPVAGPTSGTTA